MEARTTFSIDTRYYGGGRRLPIIITEEDTVTFHFIRNKPMTPILVDSQRYEEMYERPITPVSDIFDEYAEYDPWEIYRSRTPFKNLTNIFDYQPSGWEENLEELNNQNL